MFVQSEPVLPPLLQSVCVPGRGGVSDWGWAPAAAPHVPGSRPAPGGQHEGGQPTVHFIFSAPRHAQLRSRIQQQRGLQRT